MEEGMQNLSESNSKWKKRISSWFVFVINVLLMFLGYQFIKDKDKSRQTVNEENFKETKSIEAEILKLQNEIATDRENKLRDQNNTPKEIQQQTTQSSTTATTSNNNSSSSKPQKTKTS